MHKLLARQIRRFFPQGIPDHLDPLLQAVEEAYQQSDRDRAMLEHSMETVSLELADRFRRLRDALEERDDSVQAASLLVATLESTADGILVLDLNGRTVRTNARFSELWHLPETLLAPEATDQRLAALLRQVRDPDAFVAKGRELGSRPDADSYDVVQCVDGRVFERYSVPQRVGGVTVGRVWSFRDLTRRRELEEQLRQSQRMDAIGQLAAGIAHDFNNLLTVIRTHADFLLDTLSPGGQQRHDVDAIIEAARRSAGLTRQLLAFSRKQLLQPVVFDLNTVVASLEPMLRRLIGEDILVTTGAKDGPAVVSADAGQMEQVVMNLAINARDAMPRGGQLVIETALIAFGEADSRPGGRVMPAGQFVLLRVSDTGVGIAADQIDHLFEPFYTTKEVGKGTGLGLSTVYGIVKQSGGYIWVESQVGVGTVFSVYLPRAAGEVVALRDAPQPTELTGTETVLVAEDEAAVSAVTCRTLRRAGYRVLAASNGREALTLASQHEGRIDLLLTDVIMPELGGRELSEQLRARRPDIRVLYMSGYTHDEIDGRGLMQKDAAFLHKPFEIRELATAVRAALGKRPEGGAAVPAGAGATR